MRWVGYILCIVWGTMQAQEDTPPVTTQHEIVLEGKTLSYEATVGHLVLKEETGTPKARIFFTSYTKKTDSNRPITFCFNGGPGSSSVWLHLGFVGPKKIQMPTKEGNVAPPYTIIDNPDSLLDLTDLVFIDPVSTGFSQAIPPESAKQFYGVDSDTDSIADFIRLYLTTYNRWNSPKFLLGESYGTIRAAELAYHLHDEEGAYLNGVILISPCLYLQTLRTTTQNDMPYLLALPSYAAAAWKHKKLSSFTTNSLQETLEQACAFTSQDYLHALFQGDLLQGEDRKQCIEKLTKFTGLDASYLEKSNLRVKPLCFRKQLLQEDQRLLAIYDTTITGPDTNPADSFAEYDPTLDRLPGMFAASIQWLFSNILGFKSEQPYTVLANIPSWDTGSLLRQIPDPASALRSMLLVNEGFHVFSASGYYDLATPFFATEYTFAHMNLPSSALGRVTVKNYEGGHMMYLYEDTATLLKHDLAKFYEQAQN